MRLYLFPDFIWQSLPARLVQQGGGGLRFVAGLPGAAPR